MLPIDTTHSELLTAPLNKPQTFIVNIAENKR